MSRKQYADTVFVNGKVLTFNKRDDTASAVAVQDNKIIFCGSNEGAEPFCDEETTRIDLAGKILMPGFIDSHMHFHELSVIMGAAIYLPLYEINSIDDILSLLKESAGRKKPGEWVVAVGYNENALIEKRHPTRDELDEAVPGHPVRIGRCDGHSGVLNSMALELCGYDDETDLPADEAVRDNGRLTGYLKETTFTDTNPFVQFREEELLQGIEIVSNALLQAGITSVHDAGVDNEMAMRMLEHASREGIVKQRLYMMISDLTGTEQEKRLLDSFIRTGMTTGFGNAFFSFGPVKVLTDGSSSAPACMMKEPFDHDPNLKGFQLCSPEDTRYILEKAHKAGYQMTGHAQGDYSIQFMIDIITDLLEQYPGKDSRPRIEHAAMMNPELIDKMKKAAIIPTPNPGFLALYGSDYIRFYGKRVAYMYPLRDYVKAGIPAAIGTDAPVSSYEPMIAIQSAVTRKDRKTGEVVGEDQCIEVMDALRMYTYNGAYASFEENIKGSIEPGKLADMIVLSDDILAIAPEKICDVKVDLTMIDGKILYRRQEGRR